MTNIILALYGAHLIGDVLLYIPWLSNQKRAESYTRKILGTALHCFIHAILVVLLFSIFNLDQGYLAAVIIFCLHFTIDWSRVLLERRLIKPDDFLILERKKVVGWLLRKESGETAHFMNKYFKRWFVVNALDQTLHLIAILTCAWLIQS